MLRRNEKYKKKEEKEFDSRLLDLARVTRVTAGGKRLSFRAVIVSGNKKGKVGVGVAKGKDVSTAISKATRAAQRNLIEIPVLELNETIPHEVEAKYSSAYLILRPQSKGRGLVAGGAVRMICELVGIKNISSKLISKSRNKLNIARATIKALLSLKIPSSGKGKKETKKEIKEEINQELEKKDKAKKEK